MKTDRLNRWLTLGANLGVLVGLLLLVGEIRQTNNIAKAEAVNAITQNYFTLLEMQRDPRHIAALGRADLEWDELTSEEQLLLSSVGAALFELLESAYYQHRFGVYDSDQLQSEIWTLDSVLTTPWLRRQWDNTLQFHSVEIRNLVETRLEQVEKADPIRED